MERGILFSAEMVRKLLSGEKTQTRRIVKGAPDDAERAIGQTAAATCIDLPPGTPFFRWLLPGGVSPGFVCPYGAPGDRLWVRETWRVRDAAEADIDYLADAATIRYLSDGDAAWWKRWRDHSFRKDGEPGWCPSIYLPRWASRITLDVLSIRVERLHDISEEDARAEGVTLDVGCPCQGDAEEPGPHVPLCRFSFDPWPGETPFDEPRPYARAFAALWVSINGRKSWDEDPWLWVVGFKRVSP